MIELALWSLATSLLWLGILIGFARLSLVWFDFANGISFKEWYESASPRDRAMYFSARILAVFIAAGLAVSPPI